MHGSGLLVVRILKVKKKKKLEQTNILKAK